MNTINLLVWTAAHVTLVVILFNLFWYGTRLHLPSSIILSISVSFLIMWICSSGPVGEWFEGYRYAVLILAALITIICVIAKWDDSPSNTGNKQKKFTAVFRISRR